ncbi:hypothetical protein [Pontibacter sp. BAB1700]|uniref:hypothetical protein n=1 Tax=Pontibacter sp. BAB1700 TaxID=1144253 RepID=UPI00026BC984|nr:hypothetical protein [Pontibacter sp. BAB1700]EJF10592.1 hypothetical protein O71_08133 [Pontibacter sp. BAB1700]
MEVYLDRNFLDGFKYDLEGQKSGFNNFLKFIRSLGSRIMLIGNYASFGELSEHIKSNGLANQLFDEPITYYSIPDLLLKLDDVNFYSQGSSLKIFFVDESKARCTELENKFGYYFFSPKSLAESWSSRNNFSDEEIGRYFITSKDTFKNELRFDNWSKLGAIGHPLNSIVIVDKYILCDKKNQGIYYNLMQLLIELVPNCQNELPIQITIITEKGLSDDVNEEKRLVEDREYFKQVRKDLIYYLKDQRAYNTFNLSIIVLDKRTQRKLREDGFEIHDRRILTTYYWIEAGKGFNLFNDTDGLNASDSKMYFGFNANGHNILDVEHMLEGYAKCLELSTKENVHGSKKNRLLTHFYNRSVEKAAKATTAEKTSFA